VISVSVLARDSGYDTMIKIMPNIFFHALENLPSREIALPKGTLLFDRSDQVTGFYRVLEGKVHLLRQQMDGATFILQRAHAGDILAEASMTTAKFHCAAEAIIPSKVKMWPVDAVRTLVAQNGTAALGYARHLAGQLRGARLRAEIVSLRKVSDRLDAWLAWHDNRMPPKGSLYHLASEINVSPEALYRELANRRVR